MNQYSRPFSIRGFVSLLMAFTFLGLAVSGVIMYMAPPCGIAGQTGWTMLSLTKVQWVSLHQVTALIILVLAVIHLFVYNWKTFMCYFRNMKSKRRRQIEKQQEMELNDSKIRIIRIPREVYLSLLAAVVLYAGALTLMPPFGWLHEGSEIIEDRYRKEAPAGSGRGQGYGDQQGYGLGDRDGRTQREMAVNSSAVILPSDRTDSDESDGEQARTGRGDVTGEGQHDGSGLRDGSGEGLQDGTGEGVRDGSGEGLRDGSGRGARDGSGGGLRDGSGQGLRDGSGAGLRNGSGEGARIGSGEGLRDGSGVGQQDSIGEGLRDGSGEGQQDSTGEGLRDGSGGGLQDGSGEGVRDGSGEERRDSSGIGRGEDGSGEGRGEGQDRRDGSGNRDGQNVS